MAMGFRFRLATFLVVALVGIQALTAVLVYSVTRQQLLVEGQRQLGVSADAFRRQLDDMADHVAESVQVLALDFALRSAIAQRDEATVVSALANHGRRVGATRMQLVDVAGRIRADTFRGAHGATFPYPTLLERSFDKPASVVVAWRGQANWIVAVPVFAPDLVGVIAATLPVDRKLLARLQAQSMLPKSIELAGAGPGGWQLLASGAEGPSLLSALPHGGVALPREAQLTRIAGREYLAQAILLNPTRDGPPVAAVLGYSVDEALSPYRSVGMAWAVLLSLGLVVGVIGAFLIARQVSRPVELLAASARRIEVGEYGPPPEFATGGELGELASAFAGMASAIREREERIRHQAGHDLATGLPNRASAEAAIHAHAQGSPGADAALLMVGLRRMPEIVKTLGHIVGDRLMRDAGARLERIAGGGVARATDNQFSVHLPDIAQTGALASAYRIVDALSVPYQEGDLSLDMAPAVGIALAPAHGTEALVLLRRAEVALIAGLASEDPVSVYDPATDPHRPARLALVSDLREALDQDQLVLHYQPRLNLATGRVDGAEGLVRWTHPRLGNIPPDAFIPLAEETGNIRRITRWALATGITQARRWMDGPHPLRVAINLSARDFEDPQLPRRIAELLSLHNVTADRILLEVTESAVMSKPDAALATLHELAAQGIDLAIDDFGVGQSSFAYLRDLPVRELKIDKLFVQRIADAPAYRTIVRGIVELGHQLGHRVTAEGVEDEVTLDYLRGIGCDHAQGYHIARALPAPDLERFVAAREPVRPASGRE